jgi:hypothetical protein
MHAGLQGAPIEGRAEAQPPETGFSGTTTLT